MNVFYRRIMSNSLGYNKIAIPRPLMEGLGLIPGESLKIERIEDKIVMTPVVLSRPREGTTEAGTTTFKGDCNE